MTPEQRTAMINEALRHLDSAFELVNQLNDDTPEGDIESGFLWLVGPQIAAADIMLRMELPDSSDRPPNIIPIRR